MNIVTASTNRRLNRLSFMLDAGLVAKRRGRNVSASRSAVSWRVSDFLYSPLTMQPAAGPRLQRKSMKLGLTKARVRQPSVCLQALVSFSRIQAIRDSRSSVELVDGLLTLSDPSAACSAPLPLRRVF